jgi:hypothetical protein
MAIQRLGLLYIPFISIIFLVAIYLELHHPFPLKSLHHEG